MFLYFIMEPGVKWLQSVDVVEGEIYSSEDEECGPILLITHLVRC